MPSGLSYLIHFVIKAQSCLLELRFTFDETGSYALDIYLLFRETKKPVDLYHDVWLDSPIREGSMEHCTSFFNTQAGPKPLVDLTYEEFDLLRPDVV